MYICISLSKPALSSLILLSGGALRPQPNGE
jgi:hypothetical protein